MKATRSLGSLLCFAVALADVGCAPHPTTPPPPAGPEPEEKSEPEPSEPKAVAPEPEGEERRVDPILRAVSAEDRSEADRALDSQRKPAELLRFFGIYPGQRVAELAAGGGYTAELLARVVGPEGKVYGQNSPFILERFAELPWTERLKTPVMQNVARVNSEFDAPLPAEAKDLDAVLMVLFYHDTVWMKTDRAKMNKAIFAALKPGGVFGIVDHSSRKGAGVKEAETLHRIEESVVRKEVEAAGFVLDAEADFLRNPEDKRDWNASPIKAGERRGESDRFVLRFVKPKSDSEGASGSEGGSEPGAAKGTVECQDPRKSMCTREYNPVCGEVDTGIRCIQAPCPSTEKKTYSNGCTACADPKVMRHSPGACPTTTSKP